MLPQLIEVYVQSILVPSSNRFCNPTVVFLELEILLTLIMAIYVAFCDCVCTVLHYSKIIHLLFVSFLSQVYAYRALQPASNGNRDKRRFFKGKDEVFDKATFNKENICTTQNESLMK